MPRRPPAAAGRDGQGAALVPEVQEGVRVLISVQKDRQEATRYRCFLDGVDISKGEYPLTARRMDGTV